MAACRESNSQIYPFISYCLIVLGVSSKLINELVTPCITDDWFGASEPRYNIAYRHILEQRNSREQCQPLVMTMPCSRSRSFFLLTIVPFVASSSLTLLRVFHEPSHWIVFLFAYDFQQRRQCSILIVTFRVGYRQHLPFFVLRKS